MKKIKNEKRKVDSVDCFFFASASLSSSHTHPCCLLASPRCDALLGAGGSGASLGGATSTSSRVAERGSAAAAAPADDSDDEEAPLPPPALAFAMLQSALSKCWWR